MNKKVAFLNNQIDNRGTGNALFDYAHFNETILGNESYIYTFDSQPRNALMEAKLLERFGAIHNTAQSFPMVDVLYHIKYGSRDIEKWDFPMRYAVHAVFDASQPHGDRYAAISEWLGQRNNVPWVPHIIHLPNNSNDLRNDLGIPPMATVFGRHGGRETFDIPFAWYAINRALKEREDIYFLFLNTDNPSIDFYDPKRVIFLEETSDPSYKTAFINTCDAMLHARGRGETFGIAVGEFDVMDKSVLTYGNSPEQAHIAQAARHYVYYDEDDLVSRILLIDWASRNKNPAYDNIGYKKFTPEYVMQKFKEVFLD